MSSFRNILRRKRTTNVIDTALENYDDIRNSTVKDLNAAYKAMEENALGQLDLLYQTQVDVSRNTLSHTMEMSSGTNSASVRKYLEEAAVVLKSAAEVLSQYAV